MTDPTIVFDVVHAELSLREIINLFTQGFAALREAFCSIPFTRCG